MVYDLFKKNCYEWKVPIFQVPAQVAGEHIEELEERFGVITPKILLDDSRPEDAVLHSCYEWDDSKAAEKYRLYQSKKIMGNLVVAQIKEVPDKEPPKFVRAYVSVEERNESAQYVSVTKALSEEYTRQQVLKNAMAELRMFERKYRGYLDVSGILQEFLKELTEGSK